MAAPMEAATLQRTRETLGKIIKKPPLTDKLLSRPPFRYLHDIISEVNKATSFFKGLYSGAELDARSIQDKDAKVSFLQKAVDVVSFVQEDLVRVKPAKIVAGQEAEKTNEFLQLLGIAILKKLDSKDAVQRVMSGEKPAAALSRDRRKKGEKEGGQRGEEGKVKKEGGGRGEEGKEKKEGGGREERKGKKEGGGGKREEGKRSKSKERGLERKTQAKEGSQERSRAEGGRERRRGREGKKEEEEGEGATVERPQHKPSRRRQDDPLAVRGGSGSGEGGRGSGEDEGLGSETRLERPHSARGRRKRIVAEAPEELRKKQEGEPTSGVEKEGEERGVEEEEEGGSKQQLVEKTATEGHPSTQSLSPPSTLTHPPVPPLGVITDRRPGSARPAPPRVVHHSTSDEVNARVPKEMPTPPTVILDKPSGAGGGGEGEEGGEEEDEEYTVERTVSLAPPPISHAPSLSSSINDQPEGALTKAIVATKERLEGRVGGGGEDGGGDLLQGTLTPAQRKKQKEMVRNEMEALREDIQLLCRYTNPMGKAMDYLQEDTDAMQQELDKWRAENEKHRDTLRKEDSITEKELSPLRAQLDDLDSHIQEQRDQISTTKANILRQDDAIQLLLNSLQPPT